MICVFTAHNQRITHLQAQWHRQNHLWCLEQVQREGTGVANHQIGIDKPFPALACTAASLLRQIPEAQLLQPGLHPGEGSIGKSKGWIALHILQADRGT